MKRVRPDGGGITFFLKTGKSYDDPACVAARLSHGRKWVCVMTNKSVFWALHGCMILFDRFWLPYGFLHSNETRDWLAYLRQSSTFSVSIFWFCTRVWQINLACRCASSLLGNGCSRMQSLHPENRQISPKIPCAKQKVIQLFINNTDPAVWRTAEKQRIYLHKAIRIYCIKSCKHARHRRRFVRYYADPLSLT